MYRAWRSSTIKSMGLLAFFLGAVGLLGFVDVAWINLFPSEVLSHFELPNDPSGGSSYCSGREGVYSKSGNRPRAALRP